MLDLTKNTSELLALLNKYNTPSKEELKVKQPTKVKNNEIDSLKISLYNEKYDELIFKLIEE